MKGALKTSLLNAPVAMPTGNRRAKGRATTDDALLEITLALEIARSLDGIAHEKYPYSLPP